MPIKVLIADDHVFYREGVRAFLSNSLEIDVVGEAGNGNEAITKTTELQPDVILMDLKMPGTNGIESTRQIHEMFPKVGVLVLTMFDDDDSSPPCAQVHEDICSKTRIRMRLYGQSSPWKEAKRSSVPPLHNA